MVVESSAEESSASGGSPEQPDDQETQPQEHAKAEGTPAGNPDDGAAITAEEERLLLDSTVPTGSPASDASSVKGHMVSLQVNMPPHEVTEDGDTSK